MRASFTAVVAVLAVLSAGCGADSAGPLAQVPVPPPPVEVVAPSPEPDPEPLPVPEPTPGSDRPAVVRITPNPLVPPVSEPEPVAEAAPVLEPASDPVPGFEVEVDVVEGYVDVNPRFEDRSVPERAAVLELGPEVGQPDPPPPEPGSVLPAPGPPRVYDNDPAPEPEPDPGPVPEPVVVAPPAGPVISDAGNLRHRIVGELLDGEYPPSPGPGPTVLVLRGPMGDTASRDKFEQQLELCGHVGFEASPYQDSGDPSPYHSVCRSVPVSLKVGDVIEHSNVDISQVSYYVVQEIATEPWPLLSGWTEDVYEITVCHWPWSPTNYIDPPPGGHNDWSTSRLYRQSLASYPTADGRWQIALGLGRSFGYGC